MEQLTEQFKGDDGKPGNAAEETQVETKPGETQVVETKPDETKPDDTKPNDTKPDETKPDETKPDDTKPDETKPAEETKAKPDLSTLTKEEKAEHAFKRQLSKQKEKHEAEIKDLKDSFQKQLDDFKASLKQPEPKKTRKDFPLDKGGDDEYIKYLAMEGLKEAQAEQKAADEKAAAEQAEKDKAAKEEQERYDEMTKTFAVNARSTFNTQESFDAFSKKVNLALDNGLGELLDQVSTLRDFVFRNPEGPTVLNAMLSDPNNFKRVMTQTDPTMMIIAAHELATEARKPAPAAEPPKVPHMGKPGARNVSSEAGSVFNNDKDLMAYVRNVGSRRR
jgi:hypothetical protein